MPSLSSTSSRIGTCGTSPSGTVSPPAGLTRCALYDGTASTRKRGRQSRSRQATSRSGRRSRTRKATLSRKPRIAFTGVPSGAVTDSGTPWNARK